jgi:hypothetical protein
MLGPSCAIVPRADRYGHPEKVDLTTSNWKSRKLDMAAPHCDKYGHIDTGDSQCAGREQGPLRTQLRRERTP